MSLGRTTLTLQAAKEGLANLLSLEDTVMPRQKHSCGKFVIERQRVLGTDHTDTLLSQYNLATVLKHENRYAEAEKLIRETLKTQTRVLDANDPDTLASRSLLADILLEEKKPQEAEEFARPAFNDQLRTLGPLHRDTLESLGSSGLRFGPDWAIRRREKDVPGHH